MCVKVKKATLICRLCGCRRERSKVPLIVKQCVEEIERRGMDEVGIYRVSGVATDIQALKASFDSSEFCVNLLYWKVSQRAGRYSRFERCKWDLLWCTVWRRWTQWRLSRGLSRRWKWWQWTELERGEIRKTMNNHVTDVIRRGWNGVDVWNHLTTIHMTRICLTVSVVSSAPQTTGMCLSWWGRWTSMPSPEHSNCISVSCRSHCSPMSFTPTLLEALVGIPSVLKSLEQTCSLSELLANDSLKCNHLKYSLLSKLSYRSSF